VQLLQIIYFQNTSFRHRLKKNGFLPAFAKLAIKYRPGRRNTGHLATLQRGQKCLFHNNIIVNFMVYQDRVKQIVYSLFHYI